MSVGHYDCAVCEDTGIYEEYIASCNNCWKKICSSCTLIKSKDFPYIGYDIADEDNYLKNEYCPYCQGKKISNEQRVSELLEMLNISKKDLDEIILNKIKKMYK
jgi:hypothetical protein